MIIHAPIQIQMGAEIHLSVQVELAGKKKRGQPHELWFRFPMQFQSVISKEIDPFAVALLLLAMKNREPILLQGSLSRKLFQGLKEYQRIYHSWYPEVFHEIEIQPASLRDDLQNAGGVAACAFSGGVDSFYTLLTLMRRDGATITSKATKPTLSHTLFMAGFDMPRHLSQSISELTSSYSVMMKELKIQFVAGSTNIRSFVNAVDWTNAHGQALAATALFFKDSWGQFYIPSSYTATTYPKWGTHPSLDHLLSTESLKFVHHGTESNRVSKLNLISNYPESYSRLRVCWIQDIGLKNCGECEKCVRTMVALDILGKLSCYSTFGRKSLNPGKIRDLKMRTHQARLFAQELIWEAAKRLKLSVCANLGFALLQRELFRHKIEWRKMFGFRVSGKK